MKQLFFLFMFLFSFLNVNATDCIPDCENETDWTLEVRGAYYNIPSKQIERVYTSHWLDYQVEAAKRIFPFCEVFGGVYWANKHGHTRSRYGSIEHAFKDSTRMFILPIAIGLKLIYPIYPYFDAYVGAGLCYSFLKIKHFCKDHYSDYGLNRSPFKKGIYKNELGGVFKVGIHYAMSCTTFLDFFVDYYLQHFTLTHRKHREARDVFGRQIDCSGFKYGVGFGVYF